MVTNLRRIFNDVIWRVNVALKCIFDTSKKRLCSRARTSRTGIRSAGEVFNFFCFTRNAGDTNAIIRDIFLGASFADFFRNRFRGTSRPNSLSTWFYGGGGRVLNTRRYVFRTGLRIIGTMKWSGTVSRRIFRTLVINASVFCRRNEGARIVVFARAYWYVVR